MKDEKKQKLYDSLVKRLINSNLKELNIDYIKNSILQKGNGSPLYISGRIKHALLLKECLAQEKPPLFAKLSET